MMTFSQDPAVAKKQLLAIIFYLTAFGHMDGDFSATERRFVRDHIAALVGARTRDAMSGRDALAKHLATERWIAQFQKVADAIDREIAALFTESVAEGESADQFVHSKLALRCYELLKPFDEQGRASLFETVTDLVMADGVLHPNEQKLREEIQGLLDAPVEIEIDLPDAIDERSIEILPPETLVPRTLDNPFLTFSERAYSSDPAAFARRAEEDLALVRQFNAKLAEQRAHGKGRLDGVTEFRAFAGQEPFLDGHVYVLPPAPAKDYELIVIGDLHGCYSCLKAALMQTDFLAKVQAHHDDPENHPDTRLVLLGDYIDRGRFSFDGVLRGAMRLFVTVPHAVYMLRGNHEYYLEHQGRVLAPVRPAEAWMSVQGLATEAFLAEYMRMFESLPNILAFDRLLFAHGGIPRDELVAERWKDLSTLNDPDVRFQMLWSDPSETDHVPAELQRSTARFAFGTHQLRHFLSRIGCTTLIRGHERVIEGLKTVYDQGSASLMTLFSAGGSANTDLPDSSNYREVTPMALTIRHRDGINRVTPFVIDYAKYNDPAQNKLYPRAG